MCTPLTAHTSQKAKSEEACEEEVTLRQRRVRGSILKVPSASINVNNCNGINCDKPPHSAGVNSASAACGRLAVYTV